MAKGEPCRILADRGQETVHPTQHLDLYIVIGEIEHGSVQTSERVRSKSSGKTAKDHPPNPPAPACQGHPAVKIESSLSSLVTSFLSDGLQVCFPVRCTAQLSAVCCLAVCITY